MHYANCFAVVAVVLACVEQPKNAAVELPKTKSEQPADSTTDARLFADVFEAFVAAKAAGA